MRAPHRSCPSVDVDHLLEVLDRRVHERVVRADAGVRDADVESPEALDRLARRRPRPGRCRVRRTRGECVRGAPDRRRFARRARPRLPRSRAPDATAAPIPRLAPVTNATLPSRPMPAPPLLGWPGTARESERNRPRSAAPRQGSARPSRARERTRDRVLRARERPARDAREQRGTVRRALLDEQRSSGRLEHGRDDLEPEAAARAAARRAARSRSDAELAQELERVPQAVGDALEHGARRARRDRAEARGRRTSPSRRGSACGVRSPCRYGRKSTPSAPPPSAGLRDQLVERRLRARAHRGTSGARRRRSASRHRLPRAPGAHGRRRGRGPAGRVRTPAAPRGRRPTSRGRPRPCPARRPRRRARRPAGRPPPQSSVDSLTGEATRPGCRARAGPPRSSAGWRRRRAACPEASAASIAHSPVSRSGRSPSAARSGGSARRRRARAAQPEQLRRREARERPIPRERDQALEADALLDLRALGRRALVVPEDRGRSTSPRSSRHTRPCIWPERPIVRRSHAEAGERGLARAPPVLGILLRPARLRRREAVALLRRGEHLAVGVIASALTPVVPTSSPTSVVTHAPSAAYTSS